MTLEEIYTPYADEYIEENYYTDYFRSMNNPEADDHEREREHFVDLWLDSHWSASGKKLREYYGDDEFFVDGSELIPLKEWKDFAEEGIVIAYFQDEKLWGDLWEYLDLQKSIVCGYGIRFEQEQIYEEMLNFRRGRGRNM